MLSGSLVTTAWSVLGKRMGETASRYGRQLRIYYHDFRVTVDGVWICNLIYWIRTTNNCDRRVELYALKIIVTTAYTKSSQFAVALPVVAWLRIPTMFSASVLTLLPAGDCPTTNFPSVLLITRHGLHRKLRSITVEVHRVVRCRGPYIFYTGGGAVVILTRRPPFTLRKIPGTRVC
jgi:hypothetical protein